MFKVYGFNLSPQVLKLFNENLNSIVTHFIECNEFGDDDWGKYSLELLFPSHLVKNDK